MLASIAWTALLMGLAGGPHCLAMCAAPCGALTGQDGAQTVQWQPRGIRRHAKPLAFHAGRLAGYALAGGFAALAMESLAWLTQQAAVLRPAWTLLHAAVLVWGLMMMLQARQPAWIENAGRSVWRRVGPVAALPGGTLAAGLAWAFMPCGLLYSALLVAALSGGMAQGALTMALFGVGSGLWLVAGPWAWGRLRARVNLLRDRWGTRLAGLLLFAVAAWALWMDVLHPHQAPWCL